MLGASLYNRQVDIGQLYVKQRTNQLTLTGEYTLPSKSADWINPNFRADISASITELGEFAKLFGGTMEDFAGALTISGRLTRATGILPAKSPRTATAFVSGPPRSTLCARS